MKMTMTLSSTVIEVIKTVFFMKDILNVKNKQKYLSNIQPDISKQKKHLSNTHSDNIHKQICA